ncbi:MAG: phage portal protein [Pseudomonadota bacterium]
MKFTARIRKAAVAWAVKQLTLSGVDSGRGWTRLFGGGDFETGSWQQDRELTQDDILTFSPIYACITLIAGDVGKICLRLMESKGGVWQETTSNSFSPLFRKPNHYQTRQQFIENWIFSKLAFGNTYVLKLRDARGVVTSMYILDPSRVQTLVAPDGSVYYRLQSDDLSKLHVDMPAVPASEIIHDRISPLHHSLVGIPPLVAAHLPAAQGLRIQKSSEKFFKNMARPGGMLTAPAEINDETAARLKAEFEKNFSGDKLGRLFVGGDGLTFSATSIPADQSQLVEQLKLSGEQVCSAFHVPPYMVGVGPYPSYNNVQALNQQYFNQALHTLYNAIEDLLDLSLGLTPLGYRAEFDIDDLLRMDSTAQAEVLSKLVGAAIMAPDEARKRFNLPPVEGGSSPLAQQQNFSLAALAKRDAKADPFAPAPASSTPAKEPLDDLPPIDGAEPDEKSMAEAREVIAYVAKGLVCEQN